MTVKCILCGLPGSFYKEGKKIADSLLRITNERSELALYVHKECQEDK
jgi:hypothetical protein